MDFFAAQDHAHARTRTLVIYFALAVIAIIASIYALTMGIFFYASAQQQQQQSAYGHAARVRWTWWDPEVLLVVSGGVVLLIGGASVSKIAELKGGGGVVARSVGGRKLDPSTRDINERKLLNVVEEMAIASGTPVPEVYLLEHENGINAFAAGYSPDDAAVAVTRGCMEQLTRDELQGVIAHEFSHILNGDMRMNIRLMGVLFGILLLSIIGQSILRAGLWSGAGRRRGGKDNGGGAIMLFGFGIIIIGYVGVFFGRLIQSAISRQREFLADASAVQFTRNPEGIGGALMRIGGIGSQVENPHSSETAHFFFASALKSDFGGAFATHPPLEERIRRVLPEWNGQYARPKAARRKAAPPPMPSKTARQNVDAGAWVAGIGLIGQSQLAYAQQARANAESGLGDSLRDPLKARALVFALMLDAGEPLREKQLAWLEQDAGADLATAIREVYPKVAAQGPRQRLPLVELALPALSQFTREDYEAFIRRVHHLAAMDDEVSFFEFAIMRLVRRHLGRRFEDPAARARVIWSTAPLREPFARLLSALVWAGEPADAPQVFRQAVQQAPLFHGFVELQPVETLSFDALDKALDTLARARFGVKRQILTACASAVAADGKTTDQEAELLRAVAATLDCPMPPLVEELDAQ